MPWTDMLASVAYDESALLLYGSVSIGWALLALRQAERRLSTLVVAGLMAGFACGVKYTAVPFLLLGIPSAVLVTSLFEKLRRTTEHRDGGISSSASRVVGYAAIFFAAGLLSFSPWLIKNTAWAKNPVFPLGMRVLGQAHFSETKVRRFEVAHSPTAAQRSFPGRAKAVWSELLAHWQYGYALWPLACVALCLAGRRREVWFLGFMLLGIFITWIGFTHLLSRFFAIAIPVAALLIGTLPRKRSIIACVVAVLLMELVGWWGIPHLGGGLHPRLRYFAKTFGQSGAFALADPTPFIPDSIEIRSEAGRLGSIELQPLLADPSIRVALIGNAQPFIYPLPMSRLSYTTVFDVDSDAGYPDAWLPANERGHRPNRILLIHPDEIERLANTYYAVPHVPADWLANRPFLQRR